MQVSLKVAEPILKTLFTRRSRNRDPFVALVFKPMAAKPPCNFARCGWLTHITI